MDLRQLKGVEEPTILSSPLDTLERDPKHEKILTPLNIGGRRNRTKQSLVWEHYTQEAEEYAQCNHCLLTIKHKNRNTTNLWSHLKLKHHDIFLESWTRRCDTKDPTPNVEWSYDVECKPLMNPDKRSRAKQSLVWEHFQQLPDERALCLHCRTSVKHKNKNTTNLWSHLKLKHYDLFSDDTKPKKSLWEHFAASGTDEATCFHCFTSMDEQSPQRLWRHLKKRHFEAYQSARDKHFRDEGTYPDEGTEIEGEDEDVDEELEEDEDDERENDKTASLPLAWDHFNLDGNEGTCHHCKRIVKIKETFDNLWNHLKIRHQDLFIVTPSMKSCIQKELASGCLHCQTK